MWSEAELIYISFLGFVNRNRGRPNPPPHSDILKDRRKTSSLKIQQEFLLPDVLTPLIHIVLLGKPKPLPFI
jgi:hypothetical protein